MRSSAGVGQEEEDEESGEEEEEGEKDTFPSWKKTIMIGPSYQASVPSGTTNYDDRFDKISNSANKWLIMFYIIEKREFTFSPSHVYFFALIIEMFIFLVKILILYLSHENVYFQPSS